MSRWIPGLAALIVCLPAARADEGPKPVRWPGENGRTVEVHVGIVVVDFARINLREESFDMAGYLDATWVDPSLKLGEGEASGGQRRFRPGQIWAPALEFVNAVEQVVSEREGDLYVAPDGRVTQRVRFSHKFQSSFNLKRFPFDRQTLTVVVAPFDPFARDLRLVVDRGRVGRLGTASVPDWTIDAVDARVIAPPDGDDADRRFVFEVVVHRQSTFYFWRVILPLTLLVSASWLVFWFDPTNLQPQISTSLAILLSFVTFNYAVDFSLPKVAYLTLLDRYTLTSFAFVLSVTFYVSVIHVMIRRKHEAAAFRLQARGRWLLPSAYAVAIATVVLTAFA